MHELKINKAKTHSILRKHPWVFSGAIDSKTEDIQEGEIVKLLDNKGRFLAIGHFQPSTIAVRVLSFDEIEINQEFFNKQLKHAVDLRMKLNLLRKDNNIFRLVHGEGDNLPGLIVDFYNGVAVIQCHSVGMYLSLEMISSALQTALGENLTAIYSKSSDTLPERIGAENKYLFGTCETPHVALENGIKYEIDWVNGQKTGFFIDQRENRALLEKYSLGKKVLNTFCYSGGFSLASIKGGAVLAHSLDSSKKAIELTEANVKLNKMASKHESIVADTMEYIKDLPEKYDIIILDPPAFAKHRDKRHKAIQGYKRLNAHAIRQIKPGGIIFTYSCSQVVDKFLFTNTIIAAAIESGRNVRILEQLHQPADHPINAFHPEGEYLKGLVIEVE
ncbi:MAG: class I SAM-dependent rRNA methyltransferase [Flavobacteriia bacterium]|jgi:23S rRNA (cytosine1962-C5)-methyltransferase